MPYNTPSPKKNNLALCCFGIFLANPFAGKRGSILLTTNESGRKNKEEMKRAENFESYNINLIEVIYL